jgi:hypothetical protein
MITITKNFYSAVDTDIFISNYLKEFHPAGYSTTIDKLEVTPIFIDGKFLHLNYEVTISRFESCD